MKEGELLSPEVCLDEGRSVVVRSAASVPSPLDLCLNRVRAHAEMFAVVLIESSREDDPVVFPDQPGRRDDPWLIECETSCSSQLVPYQLPLNAKSRLHTKPP